MPLAPLVRPLVVFDLETTGLLVELDRIIEIGLVKLFPDGHTDRLVQRFNPCLLYTSRHEMFGLCAKCSKRKVA